MVERKAPSWEERFEKRMKRLEKRMEVLGERLEEKGEEFGQRVEAKAKRLHNRIEGKNRRAHNLFWGIVLVSVGFLWLGNNLDWFDYDIPWVPVVLIALGIFLIIRHWEKEGPPEAEESETKG